MNDSRESAPPDERLCAKCHNTWPSILMPHGTLVCSVCWLEWEKARAPVKGPAK